MQRGAIKCPMRKARAIEEQAAKADSSDGTALLLGRVIWISPSQFELLQKHAAVTIERAAAAVTGNLPALRSAFIGAIDSIDVVSAPCLA